jgi:hypothetical protein
LFSNFSLVFVSVSSEAAFQTMKTQFHISELLQVAILHEKHGQVGQSCADNGVMMPFLATDILLDC